MHILSSYNEGRFGQGYKCYGMPKGKVDEGEAPLDAAVRETYEESNIDIKALLGSEAYERFKKGEIIKDLESPGYPGVKIVKAEPLPVVKHQYISGYGIFRPTQYFAIELEGIEKLRPYLKRMMQNDSQESAYTQRNTAGLRANMKLPAFRELLNAMRTGEIDLPQTGTGQESRVKIIEHPALPAVEAQWCQDNNMPLPQNIVEWKELCATVAGPDFKKLMKDADAIADTLAARGLIGHAGDQLKLDTKDTPLNYYQEGAEILPLSTMLRRSLEVAARNEEYGRAMWGQYAGRRRPNPDEATMLKTAQMAPVLEYFAKKVPMEIAATAIEEPNDVQKLRNHRLYAPGMRLVDHIVEPTVASGEWRDRVLAKQPVEGAARIAR